jgi:acetolactate decarboxylase
MRKAVKLLFLVSLLLLVAYVPAYAQAGKNTLSQVSTFDALMKGYFDGVIPTSDVSKYGDQGIGTFEGLDGEMLVVDGKVYQVPVDGVPKIADPTQPIPYLQVTFFNADQEQKVSAGTDMKTFTQDLETKLPTKNDFYAIRVEGTFQKVKTRSVAKQSQPYPNLLEAVKKQAVFDLANVEGVMVGFWSPAYFKGIGVPGYHLHFLTKDGKAGGHVLDFVAQDAEAKLDRLNNFYLILPDTQAFNQMDFTVESGDTQSVLKPKQ